MSDAGLDSSLEHICRWKTESSD